MSICKSTLSVWICPIDILKVRNVDFLRLDSEKKTNRLPNYGEKSVLDLFDSVKNIDLINDVLHEKFHWVRPWRNGWYTKPIMIRKKRIIHHKRNSCQGKLGFFSLKTNPRTITRQNMWKNCLFNFRKQEVKNLQFFYVYY